MITRRAPAVTHECVSQVWMRCEMHHLNSWRMNYPAASCEVSNSRLRTAMARQFGGVELVYLVSVFPRTLKQPQLDVLAMQLHIAFVTALLSYITQVATY
jgi:hypothetical protein